MPAKKRTPKPDQYTIELKQGENVKRLEAPTIVEGLNSLTNDYPRTAALLTVTKGDTKAELRLYPPVLRRLMVNPLTRLLMEKRLLTMMK
jgi:hypothetical protein